MEMRVSLAVRRIWCFLADLTSLVGGERELTVDMRRVNVELRRALLAGLEDDVVYRERVKERIREGARCSHPPLIDRRTVLTFAALQTGSWDLR
jgi:hypothetical protein